MQTFHNEDIRTRHCKRKVPQPNLDPPFYPNGERVGSSFTAPRPVGERPAFDILYQPMSRPEPMRRSIEPDALVYDGFRSHARAFDRETGEFRDFGLGRVSKPKSGGEAGSKSAADADWHSFVDLVIAPHPELTPAQARAIAMDYAIQGASTSIRVRRALLFYALKRLGLDVAPNARPPSEQHVVLVNRDEVQAQLTPRTET